MQWGVESEAICVRWHAGAHGFFNGCATPRVSKSGDSEDDGVVGFLKNTTEQHANRFSQLWVEEKLGFGFH